MRALVVRGTRNVFTLREINDDNSFDKKEIECGIKGKKLKGVEGYYNPLAPGDIVETEKGLITKLIDRKNTFARFNQKGQARQLLAANVDLVICVTTVSSPPFRPRFLDRVLFQSEYSGIPAVIVCNKTDLKPKAAAEFKHRINDFRRIGYEVLMISALNGEGIEELRSLIKNKTVVLTGQSGVGKSTIINSLYPELCLKTGALNEKYQRGNHTTTQSVLFNIFSIDDINKNTAVIDTPGIRRFAPLRMNESEVIQYFREFAPLEGKCDFGLSCSHETEKGCKIRKAVAEGAIHHDRYISYMSLKHEMAGTDKYPDND